MTSASTTVVLVPTFNERDNVKRIVPAILAAAPVDVCVIDDSSPDGTGVLADELARADGRVHVLHRPAKQGLGRAYLAGFRWALDCGYQRVVEMDADFSHQPRYLPKLMALCDSHDVALGSRWVADGGTERWPLSRQLISRAGSLYARAWLGVPLRDLTGGFKCFRREVLESLDLDAIGSTGYAFQIEVTYRALRHGFRVAELPIVFVERESGVSKMSRRIVIEAILRVPLLRFTIGPRRRAARPASPGA